MAFSFGASSSTPSAPPSSGGGFSFGAAPAAPATSTAASSSTPSSTGFSFFGSSGSAPPAPSTGGSFSFGGSGTNAPSSGFGGLSSSGGTTAAAGSSSSGGGGGGLFSFSSPAPASASTTTTSTFGNTGTLTGFPSTAGPQTAASAPSGVGRMTAHAPFSALPPNGQKIIHDIYALLHQHNQTMSSVSTMIPSSLFTVTHTADQAAGGIDGSRSESTMMTSRLMDLNELLKELVRDMEREARSVEIILHESQELYKLTHQCAIYPVQNIAKRRSIALPPIGASVNEGGDGSIVEKLNTLLQENSSQVDRLEGMPSLYLWRTMENLRERNEKLYQRIGCMKNLLNGRKRMMGPSVVSSRGGEGETASYKEHRMEELSLKMQMQVENLVRVAGIVGKMNERIEDLKLGYKRYIAKQTFQRGTLTSIGNVMGPSYGSMKSGIGIGIGEGDLEGSYFADRGVGTFDPFAEADRKELENMRRVEVEVRRRAIEASKSVPSMNASTPLTANTGTATGGGLFGSSTPAPAPTAGGFSFGGNTSTPAPAPTGGGLFGSSTPVAAPAAGGFSFGGSASTPAPAPTGGGGLFGSTTANASTGSGFSFGSGTGGNPAPSSGGLSFGSTSAPAPAGGTLFGGAASSAPVPSSLKTRRKAGRRR
jgi:hypothetical protein